MIASISLPPDSLFNPDFCPPSLQANRPASDWRDLIALGVTQTEARSMARRLMLTYWRRLLKAGVALHTARRLARTIAKYDVMARLPTLQQQNLLRQHCPAICRSGLWRVEMLLQIRS